MEPNQCSANVQKAVSKFGGEMVTGWLVTDCHWWWQYIHHAVWKTPEGQLVDITPQFAELHGDDALSYLMQRDFWPDPSATFIGHLGRPCRYIPKPSSHHEIASVCEYLRLSDRCFYLTKELDKAEEFTAKANSVLRKYGGSISSPPIEMLGKFKVDPQVWHEYDREAGVQ